MEKVNFELDQAYDIFLKMIILWENHVYKRKEQKFRGGVFKKYM